MSAASIHFSVALVLSLLSGVCLVTGLIAPGVVLWFACVVFGLLAARA
jgi:hypothetical protein